MSICCFYMRILLIYACYLEPCMWCIHDVPAEIYTIWRTKVGKSRWRHRNGLLLGRHSEAYKLCELNVNWISIGLRLYKAFMRRRISIILMYLKQLHKVSASINTSVIPVAAASGSKLAPTCSGSMSLSYWTSAPAWQLLGRTSDIFWAD